MTATELRANLYRVLDEVLETGVPTTVSHKGRSVLLAPATSPKRRFGSGPKRSATGCSIDELAAVSWEDAWSRYG